MNIEISVDNISLDTIVGQVIDFDEDGDAVSTGTERTVADLVAEKIVTKLVGNQRYSILRDKVLEIRTEEIRAAVRPSINEALTRPIYKTNTYGERTGQETTLAELIADEARKQLAEPADRYSSAKGTVLQQAIRAEVQAAFKAEIAEAVKAVRKQVAGELGGTLADQLTKAVAAGFRNA